MEYIFEREQGNVDNQILFLIGGDDDKPTPVEIENKFRKIVIMQLFDHKIDFGVKKIITQKLIDDFGFNKGLIDGLLQDLIQSKKLYKTDLYKKENTTGDNEIYMSYDKAAEFKGKQDDLQNLVKENADKFLIPLDSQLGDLLKNLTEYFGKAENIPKKKGRSSGVRTTYSPEDILQMELQELLQKTRLVIIEKDGEKKIEKDGKKNSSILQKELFEALSQKLKNTDCSQKKVPAQKRIQYYVEMLINFNSAYDNLCTVKTNKTQKIKKKSPKNIAPAVRNNIFKDVIEQHLQNNQMLSFREFPRAVNEHITDTRTELDGQFDYIQDLVDFMQNNENYDLNGTRIARKGQFIENSDQNKKRIKQEIQKQLFGYLSGDKNEKKFQENFEKIARKGGKETNEQKFFIEFFVDTTLIDEKSFKANGIAYNFLFNKDSIVMSMLLFKSYFKVLRSFELPRNVHKESSNQWNTRIKTNNRAIRLIQPKELDMYLHKKVQGLSQNKCETIKLSGDDNIFEDMEGKYSEWLEIHMWFDEDNYHFYGDQTQCSKDAQLASQQQNIKEGPLGVQEILNHTIYALKQKWFDLYKISTTKFVRLETELPENFKDVTLFYVRSSSNDITNELKLHTTFMQLFFEELKDIIEPYKKSSFGLLQYVSLQNVLIEWFSRKIGQENKITIKTKTWQKCIARFGIVITDDSMSSFEFKFQELTIEPFPETMITSSAAPPAQIDVNRPSKLSTNTPNTAGVMDDSDDDDD